MTIVAFDALFFVSIVADRPSRGPFQQSAPHAPISLFRFPRPGSHRQRRAAKDAYDKALAAADKALDWLKTQPGKLELLSIPSRTDDVKAAAKVAGPIAKYAKTVAVLGIGGSSLGGQALTVLARAASPKVEFHDNPDPFSWTAALKRFDLKKTHFVAISK